MSNKEATSKDVKSIIAQIEALQLDRNDDAHVFRNHAINSLKRLSDRLDVLQGIE